MIMGIISTILKEQVKPDFDAIFILHILTSHIPMST